MDQPQPSRFPELPGYQIQKVLGRGGMGRVYLATDTRLHRSVAIKTLVDTYDDELVLRFETEVQAAAKLDHPQIAKIYDFLRTTEGVPACVMELLTGGSLADKIRDQPPSFQVAARVVETLAVAIHASHLAGIIHRDLKPANILLAVPNPNEINPLDLRIVDFGLAKSTATDSGLTQTGQVLGTPAYMAPEQASGLVQRIGPAADIYALGGILYELLVGKPPFLSNDPVQTLMMVLSTDPVAPRELNRHVPRDLQTICLKCLEKKANRRYPSALALAEDLRRWLDHRPIQSRPVAWYTRVGKWVRRNPWQTVAGCLLVAFTLGSLWASWSLNESYRETQTANKLLGESNADLEQATRDATQAFELSRTTLDRIISEIGYKLEELPQAETLVDSTLRDTADMYQRLLELRPTDPSVLKSTIMSLENVRILDWQKGDVDAEANLLQRINELQEHGAKLYPDDPWFGARIVRAEIEKLKSLPLGDESTDQQVQLIQTSLDALNEKFPDSSDVALAICDWYAGLFGSAAERGDVSLARQALRDGVEAARRYRQLSVASNPNAFFYLVRNLRTSATIELALGEYAMSQSLLSEARTILAEVSAENRSREYRHVNAEVTRLEGSIAYHQQNFELAREQLEAAVAIFERLAFDYPNEVGFQISFAQTRYELASVFMALEQEPVAKQQLEAAQKTIAAVLARDPNHFVAQNLNEQIQAALERFQPPAPG